MKSKLTTITRYPTTKTVIAAVTISLLHIKQPISMVINRQTNQPIVLHKPVSKQ